MEKPFITVAVAAYNAEKFIRACLDSILKQTFCDFELLIADDGSTDGTRDICAEYQKKDGRIRILSLVHGGLAAARNALVSAARGEYIAFIDSDDVVHPQYLEILYFAATKANADMAVCAFCEFESELPKVEPVLPLYKFVKYDTRSALKKMVDFSSYEYIKYIFSQCKIIRTAILRKITYPVGRIYEDETVSGEILYYCERGVAEVDYRLYYYYRNMNGISKSPVSEKNLDAGAAIEHKIEFFADKKDYRDIYLALVKQGYEVYNGKWAQFKIAAVPDELLKRLLDMYVAYYKKYKKLVRPSYAKYYAFYCFLHPALRPYYFLRYTLERNGFRGSIKKLFKKK